MPLEKKKKDNKIQACITIDADVSEYLNSQVGYNRSEAINEIIKQDMIRSKKTKKKS